MTSWLRRFYGPKYVPECQIYDADCVRLITWMNAPRPKDLELFTKRVYNIATLHITSLADFPHTRILIMTPITISGRPSCIQSRKYTGFFAPSDLVFASWWDHYTIAHLLAHRFEHFANQCMGRDDRLLSENLAHHVGLQAESDPLPPSAKMAASWSPDTVNPRTR